MSNLAGANRTKVCILTSVHLPFDGRVFHKEAKSLVKADYDVALVAQHDTEETVDGIRILPLPKPKNRFDRATRVAWKLLRLALKEDAHVYHFHDPELIPVGLFLKLRGRKVIWDVHEHYPNSIADRYWIPKSMRYVTSRLFDLAERVFVRFFDYVVYTTPIVGERYTRMKVRSERIDNYPIIELSESFAKDPQESVIYLGGMSKIRGIIELIEAFHIVTRKHPKWKLRLVGRASPSSFGEEIKQLISKLNLDENVSLIPWVPYEEKERLSSQASIGIVTYLPYANNVSCLPNKLFDYMLVGLPVVVSNFPQYKEVVETDRCGLIVDPSDPADIAKAIEYLIGHPEEAKKMGENGREAVLRRYNWGNESKKLLRIYRELLDGTAGE
ncbi:MAG: glycosyltransferase family 4 protein [Phycisphaerales bacterium]|nr:MAG: glycosyltransferase family 4 protein [Phycisphaerales bacterium]